MTEYTDTLNYPLVNTVLLLNTDPSYVVFLNSIETFDLVQIIRSENSIYYVINGVDPYSILSSYINNKINNYNNNSNETGPTGPTGPTGLLQYSIATTDSSAGIISVGSTVGQTGQQAGAISMGWNAGNTGQGINAVAMGVLAGATGQGTRSVAIGPGAGQISQGANAIAIGRNAGQTTQAANSIVISALGSIALNAGKTGSTYIAPIGATGAASLSSNTLVYNTTTFEVCYNTTKTFVIDHPVDKSKYLVHACLEGPESGVYYRGKSEITNNESVTIELPEYVDALAKDFTIQITPIYSNKQKQRWLEASEIENNSFTVYGENTKFYWIVHGKRDDIIVEPLKSTVNVKGNGPYKWI
jgi:hypothetical protein